MQTRGNLSMFRARQPSGAPFVKSAMRSARKAAPRDICRSALTDAPLFLWFLDHELDHGELRRQVREFKAKGWGGFFMHWIIGEPYLGQRWLDALEVCIEAAAEAGLEAWLYDEAWCPSNFAGGRVLARRPDLEAHMLWHVIRDVAASGELCLDFELANVIRVVALPLKNGVPQPDGARDLTVELGTVLLDPAPPYRHTNGYYPHVKPLVHWRKASRQRFWRLRWRPPAGTWRVYVFCDRGAWSVNHINFVDILNPDGVAEFLAETHEIYAKRFGKYFGTVIPGVMTDEPKYLPLPWTPRFPAEFQKRTGIDLLDTLPVLVDAAVPGGAYVRAEYVRVAGDLFRENFIAPMAKWCHEHNLLLTGHISPEEDPSGEVDYLGSLARLLESFDLPGTDLIIQAVGDAERPALNLGPRVASTVALQQGKERVFVEVGACCEEDMSLEDLKHLCDWLYVNGINVMTIHGLAYSLDSWRKFLAGQTYSYQWNPWQHIDLLTAYLRQRTQQLIEYRPYRDVAVLKPHTAMRVCALPGKDNTAERNTVDEALIALLWALLQAHYDVDLLDEDTAERWKVDQDLLRCGKAAYRLVLIPQCDWISRAANNKLAAFAANGGHVLCVGPPPATLTPMVSGKVGQSVAVKCLAVSPPVCSAPDVAAVLRAAKKCVAPPVRICGPNAQHVLASSLRNRDGDRAVLLVNLRREDVSVTVDAGRTSLGVTLAPWESRFLPAGKMPAGSAAEKRIGLEIKGPWSVKADALNHVPLVQAKTRLVIALGAEPTLLVVDSEERAAVAAALKLDGQTLCWDALRPERFYDHMNFVLPIAGLLPPGEHTIELDVTSCPTVLVAGCFAAFASEGGWCLAPEPLQVDGVDRIAAGYPFVRGALRFRKEFALEVAAGKDTVLTLPGRRGSVAVHLDDRACGVVAWAPDTLTVGPLKRGRHTLELAVVGDSIGVLRAGPCPAGLTAPPHLGVVNHDVLSGSVKRESRPEP